MTWCFEINVLYEVHQNTLVYRDKFEILKDALNTTVNERRRTKPNKKCKKDI